MQARNYTLTVAVAIIIASVIYSGILLKTNLDIVGSSKNSLVSQQLNVQELSTALGNLQLNINRFIVSRSSSSSDSLYHYKKLFLFESNRLYQISRNVPELKKWAEVIYFSFPKNMQHVEEKLKNLPQKLTIHNATNLFDENSNPFSDLWIALDHVRFYQIKSIKSSTNETIAAGSRGWKVSILGSIFLMAVVFCGYIIIKENNKKLSLARAKETASEALWRENEKLLQAVIDNCNAVIFVKDKNSRFTLINKSFKEVFQLENEQVLGKIHEEIFMDIMPDYQPTSEEPVLKRGEIQTSTQEVNIRNQITYYITTKFPLYGAGGEIFGIGAICTDVTKQREHEKELIRFAELAEAAKTSQQHFLANMSHEIRTPMNGVIGMTNLLYATPLNAEQEDYVNVIRQSSNILMLLINDILDVSKMQAGMLKLEKIPFDLRESLKQIYLSYKPLADEMGISLQCNIESATPEFLLGDPFRLNQIISNLVNNAIKFTSSGGVLVNVKAVQKEADVFELLVEVTDTGIGIPADKLQEVFKSFTQSSTSTTRKYGGTGLGLAIVKELTEMQNGQVELESELNIGSTFRIKIPYLLAKMDKSQQQKSKGAKLFSSLKNKKILVVEDNLINQKVARQILLNAGFETVDVADNGFIALDMLRNGTHDAVLMDVQMPDMDGMETTRRIRRDLKLSLPVIALTASALIEDREICLSAGMNEYITKPFVPEELLQKLSALLQ